MDTKTLALSKSIEITNRKQELMADGELINISYGTFLGSDNKTTIEFFSVTPKTEPETTLQLVHGMAEYKERYMELGKYLARNGVAFFIADNLGHGNSTLDKEHLGYIEDWNYLIQDCKTLCDYIDTLHPKAVHAFCGHSMGSFIARAFLAKFPNEVDKAVFSGTALATPLTKVGKYFAKLIALTKGPKYRSRFIEKQSFGSFNKKIKNPKTSFDWLSYNEENVRAYVSHPLCGFPFTAKGFENLCDMIAYVSKKSTISKYRKGLPIYLISGKDDPVSNYGTDLWKLENILNKLWFSNVSVSIYENMRHEIFQENNKEKVWSDLLNFTKKQ